MLHDVVAATYKGDYRIELTFDDGKSGIVDFSDYPARGGVFERFRDLDFFRSFRVSEDAGTIVWGDEIDVAPETLYSAATGSPLPAWMTEEEPPARPTPRSTDAAGGMVHNPVAQGQSAIAFSPWRGWASRGEHSGTGSPGVYLLARFFDGPPASADPLDPNVIYVGETCDQSLAIRLCQFERSAFGRKAGHAGGWTFSKHFLSSEKGAPPQWLYVSLLPVSSMDGTKRSAYIRFVERQIIWGFVEKHGKLPVCNKK